MTVFDRGYRNVSSKPATPSGLTSVEAASGRICPWLPDTTVLASTLGVFPLAMASLSLWLLVN